MRTLTLVDKAYFLPRSLIVNCGVFKGTKLLYNISLSLPSAPQSSDLCERAVFDDLLRDSTGRSLSSSHIFGQFLIDLVI